jgi:nucleoside-diphosphate-sugar epimerase
MIKKDLLLGAGAFIGSQIVDSLKEEVFWVKGVDLNYPDFKPSSAGYLFPGDNDADINA